MGSAFCRGCKGAQHHTLDLGRWFQRMVQPMLLRSTVLRSTTKERIKPVILPPLRQPAAVKVSSSITSEERHRTNSDIPSRLLVVLVSVLLVPTSASRSSEEVMNTTFILNAIGRRLVRRVSGGVLMHVNICLSAPYPRVSPGAYSLRLLIPKELRLRRIQTYPVGLSASRTPLTVRGT